MLGWEESLGHQDLQGSQDLSDSLELVEQQDLKVYPEPAHGGRNWVRKPVFQPSISQQAGSTPMCGPAVRGKSAHFLAILVQTPAARNEQRSGWKGRGSHSICIGVGCSLMVKLLRTVRRVSMKGACVKEDFTYCVPLCVRFLIPVVVPMKQVMHFHLTRLFAYLLTYVFPMSLQGFMDFRV